MNPVIIKSHILSFFNELVHGISTKVGSENDANFNLGINSNSNKDEVYHNRKFFFKSLNIDENSIVYQQQVHSNRFQIVETPCFIKENDALITFRENLFLIVTVADCIPVLFYDSSNRITGAIHAGWRGTYSKIVLNTIDFAISKLSLDKNNTYFYLGPSICGNCFEVDEDVANLFEPRFVKKKNKKFTVDLQQINLQYLLDLGIKRNNIQISKLCTFELNQLLHSYRRDKEKSGRMFGVIGIRK